uniref:Putative secreted protein n=1 Tax=Ixodes ricinus TaxID=34613 RepID=A0A6B0UC09_IXORI
MDHSRNGVIRCGRHALIAAVLFAFLRPWCAFLPTGSATATFADWRRKSRSNDVDDLFPRDGFNVADAASFVSGQPTQRTSVSLPGRHAPI